MSAFEPTIFLELNEKEASLIYEYIAHGAEVYSSLKPDAKERTLDILDRLVEAFTDFSK